MSDTTTRALSLLNLLQTHRHWPGSELADRLGVTERTVRRDVERLRDLGYRIESSPGATGGYRLEAGSAVPPLLLTDEEAVAMAIGLRVAASQRLVGGPETTITALAKLEQVLPAPLRRRVDGTRRNGAARGHQRRRRRIDRGARRTRARLPRQRARPLHLHRGIRRGHPAPGRAARARPGRPALVPAVLGSRRGRLAHVPRRQTVRTSPTRASSSSRGRSPRKRSRSSS